MERTFDIHLWTDGSGHEDGFGGWSCLASTPDKLVQRFAMGSVSGTSVDRMEFTAMIEGLRLVLEMWKKFPGVYENPMSDNPTLKKPRVLWFSDRESLVLSVKKVYSRDNCPDLWEAFSYYENLMYITARHITEPDTETIEEFVEVDRQSSTARIVMKSYFAATPLTVDPAAIKPKTRKKKDVISTDPAGLPDQGQVTR